MESSHVASTTPLRMTSKTHAIIRPALAPGKEVTTALLALEREMGLLQVVLYQTMTTKTPCWLPTLPRHINPARRPYLTLLEQFRFSKLHIFQISTGSGSGAEPYARRANASPVPRNDARVPSYVLCINQ